MGLQPEIQVTTSIEALSDYSDGLPQIPGMKLPPRPVDTMPAIYDFADPTIRLLAKIQSTPPQPSPK